MQTLEGFSRESKQDAIAQALTSADIEKAGDDERIDVNIMNIWEDADGGFHATVAVHHTKLPKTAPEEGPSDFNDMVDYEAVEALGLFVPDVAHQYRKADEETETMKEDPRFAEMHKKIEHDFEEAEHPRKKMPPPPKPKATHPEPHIEGSSEEEDR